MYIMNDSLEYNNNHSILLLNFDHLSLLSLNYRTPLNDIILILNEDIINISSLNILDELLLEAENHPMKWTIFHFIIDYNLNSIFKLIMKKYDSLMNVKLTSPNNTTNNILQYIQKMKKLLRYKNINGKNCLHFAIKNKNNEIITELLKYESNMLYDVDNNNISPFEMIIEFYNDEDLLNFFSKLIPDNNKISPCFSNEIQFNNSSCMEGKEEKFNSLIQINSPNKNFMKQYYYVNENNNKNISMIREIYNDNILTEWKYKYILHNYANKYINQLNELSCKYNNFNYSNVIRCLFYNNINNKEKQNLNNKRRKSISYYKHIDLYDTKYKNIIIYINKYFQLRIKIIKLILEKKIKYNDNYYITNIIFLYLFDNI